jgi:hypothetical protein
VIYFGGRQVVGFGDASCPDNSSPPSEYVIWRGPVPPELTQWAITLRDLMSQYPYGQTWTTIWNGATVLARKDHHTFTYRRLPDGSATLLTGICIPGITIYRERPRQAGLNAADATDPATALPDPELALYSVSATQPPERTDWGLVLACAAAIAVVSGGFVWGVRAAGR